MAKILFVEDDRDLAMAVKDCLIDEHYAVDVVHDGLSAMSFLTSCEYDVIILDWYLPKADGLDVLVEFRSKGGKTPILMLTARSAVNDKESGLDAGADDYLTKPFEPRELSARIRALLRRKSTESSNVLTVGSFTIDPLKFKVWKSGLELRLQPTEFALLEFFMRHPGEVFSHEAVLSRVWPTDSPATTETLRVFIGTLRKKIDDQNEPSYIETVHRVGYRFVATGR